MDEFYMGLSAEELIAAYREAVTDNTHYRWIKAADSPLYGEKISQIENELLRRLKGGHAT